MTLSSEKLETYRRAVVAEMGNAAAKLAALKAGENVTLATLRLPHDQDPGLTPLEKAQMHYDYLKAVLASFQSGTYGQCARCGAEIAEPALDGLPWADECGTC